VTTFRDHAQAKLGCESIARTRIYVFRPRDSGEEEKERKMPHRRRKKKRSRYIDASTEEGRKAQAEAAFAAIRALYCESLPLWRTCARGFCRRHHACGGDNRACLKRTWPLMPEAVQTQAYELVRRGGPRRLRAATHREWILRGYPPSNFTH
jgi:hypothetical protein